MSGREKKRKEREQELEARIDNMRNVIGDFRSYGLSSEKQYSTHDILADIEVAKSLGRMSQDQMQELNRCAMYINQTYKIEQDRVERKVQQKREMLVGSQRADMMIEECSQKIDRGVPANSRMKEIEKYYGSVGRYIADLNKGMSMHRDYNRDI